MALDATTLKNLEVLGSSHSDGRTGSLWALLDHCRTPFGSRLLKAWLARPLLDARDVAGRAEAVDELVDDRDARDDLRRRLGKIPDLERSLQQLHTLGSARRAKGARNADGDDDMSAHPDARAILFDFKKFNARKVAQLAEALQGLKRCGDLVDAGCAFASPLLRRCLGPLEGPPGPNGPLGCFPELPSVLEPFDGYDLAAAKKTGELAPRRGVDAEYDALLDARDARTGALDAWLAAAKKKHAAPGLSYKATAKDRFCVDVPEEYFGRGRRFEDLPPGWTQRTKTKKARSFAVRDVAPLVEALDDADAAVSGAKLDALRRLFAAFDDERDRWTCAVRCVATLDALLALAHVSAAPGFCRATLAPVKDAVLSVVDGAHPCLEGDVISNDVAVGGNSPKMLLLSGPNMGGKSTLLRHACVSAILAQVGCRVRAASLTLSPVDRVFTRLGASDKILEGQSTFMVELLETATILKAATPQSLVILDELGRGTATFDGCAIAHAVVDHLVADVGCRALFATHYHDLVASWAGDPRVALGHMDCLVRDGGNTVVFLYKLTAGCSPKSFGINVARMARLPKSVLKRAAEKSAELEAALNDG